MAHRLVDDTPFSRRQAQQRRQAAADRTGGCVHKSCGEPVWQAVPELNLCRGCALRIQGKVNAYLTPLTLAPPPPPTTEPKAPTVRPGSGTIYYLRVGDSLKIGFASNLASRMSAYPPNAVLLATHPGTRTNEATLHNLFAEYRVAGREWYEPAPALLDHIDTVRQRHGEPVDLFAARQAKAAVQKPPPITPRRRSGYSYSRSA